ncbi:unnamed protein product [Linum trigynum]|uniref:Reverse transcriptase n=1 Tax=Linum trigynum TaxID=586398 RepID=A0AAV2CJP5_9ROSI
MGSMRSGANGLAAVYGRSVSRYYSTEKRQKASVPPEALDREILFPLSPFLFILMSNALTFLIDKAVAEDRIKGIKLNMRSPSLTHCLFADDTVIFGKASIQEAERIMEIINDYGLITDQEVNINESSVFFSANVPAEEKNDFINHIGFSPSNCNSKYLGVPT